MPFRKPPNISVFSSEKSHLIFFAWLPGKHYNCLHMARFLQIDVRFCCRSQEFIKAYFCHKTHRFLPLFVLENRSKTVPLLIICKPTDLPTASRLRSDGTSPKSHRLNLNHHRVFHLSGMAPFPSKLHHPLCGNVARVPELYVL